MATSAGSGPGSRATPTTTAIASSTTSVMTTPKITSCSRRDRVDLGPQLEAPVAEPADVVGGERHRDALPPEVEVRVVVLRLGEESDAHDEGDRSRKVPTVEGAGDLVARALPPGELGQPGGRRVVVEPGPHAAEASGVRRRFLYATAGSARPTTSTAGST